MNELAYLGLAVAVSTVGSMVVWYRQRKPESLDSGVQDFARALEALGAPTTSPRGRRTYGGGGDRTV